MHVPARTCSIFLWILDFNILCFVWGFFLVFFFLSQGTAHNPNALKKYQKLVSALKHLCVEIEQENIWISEWVCFLWGSKSVAIKWHAQVLRSQPVLYEKTVSHYALTFFWACEDIFNNSVLKQIQKKHFLW